MTNPSLAEFAQGIAYFSNPEFIRASEERSEYFHQLIQEKLATLQPGESAIIAAIQPRK